MPSRGERWSSFYDLDRGQTVGDEVIEVYEQGATVLDGSWLYLEIIGRNELWVGFDGWYYKSTQDKRVQCCQQGMMTTVKSWGHAVRGKGTVTAIANVKAS